MMVAGNQTCHQTESDLAEMYIIRDGEPIPDRTAPVRHMQVIQPGWMDGMLAPDCLAEANGADAPLGADVSGAETARYEQVGHPGLDARDFVGKPRKVSTGRCHIAAIPGLQIILAAAAMSGGLYDANMLDLMLDGISAAGSSSRPPISCLHVVQRRVRFPDDFWMDMISLSIRQRRGAANRARPTGGGQPDRLIGTSIAGDPDRGCF